MSLVINTNVSSLNANRHLVTSTKVLSKTFERLSSGLRINSAKDDAAGLSISTRMTAQFKGINMAIRNANDGVSLLQVAEGALIETENALQRMRELAVQSLTATMTGSDRDDLQKEVTELMKEINRIAGVTEFNDQKVLDNTFLGKKFQVGWDQGQTITLSITGASVGKLGLSTGAGSMNALTLGASGFSVSVTGGYLIAEYALIKIDTALNSVSDLRADLGAYQNRFESLIANLSNISENTAAARSRILDADIAAETANLTKNAIMQQAGTAILAQANQQPQIALQLLG